ncbi:MULTISPECIES: acyltransferase family protein [Luteibacter]|uniref:acyltransferase family protein n=1 Tax=Luteibacter TaxID=242605 RepID=UPI00068D0233|nr:MULTISPECIES: acyltransferase [unclassified Luteibacter]SKC00696.1 Peptidoglycan/LPS O-acetylase OafA/YrhL, contains acyltransferase and SGNH-hydrolase domains [Luteibacter sp. 22Crub2.1]
MNRLSVAEAQRIELDSVEERVVTSRPRLDFMDALRGLAASYVVLYHMVLLPMPNLPVPPWLAAFAGNGGSGVTLFFVASTFSLFYTMPSRLKEPTPRISFYLHRLFRIAPLFYAVVLASMLRDYLVFGVSHSGWEVAGMVTFIFNLIPGHQESFVWAGWTIGVEMLFYAAFPAIYARVRTIYGAIAFFLVTLIAWNVLIVFLPMVPLSDVQRASVLQWFVLRHLPIFAIGGICFYALQTHLKSGSRSQSQASLGAMLVLLAMFLYMALLSSWLPNIFGAQYYWQGVVYGLAVCGLCLWPWSLLVNRLTMFLGKISYSLYLIHPTVIYFLTPAYRNIYSHVPRASLALAACLALTLAVASLISYVTYRLVEEPSIKVGRRLYARFRNQQSPKASAA